MHGRSAQQESGMLLGRGHQLEGDMVHLLSYTGHAGLDTDDGPKEIVKTPSATGDNGWLIRFFDSAFFCEWIAVSYLYKHDHSGVRDYLCNRMYTLPLTGIESYLFQLCYMAVHMPSPSLEKYIVDMCTKSLRIATKVHWFLMAEAEDVDDSQSILKMQERCQMAALEGDWLPLIRPQKIASTHGSKSRVFKAILSSRRLLPLASNTPPHRTPPPVPSPAVADEGFREANRPPVEEIESSLKVLKKFIPTTKVRDAFMKKFWEKDDKEGKGQEEFATDRVVKETDSDSFFKRLFRDKDEDEKGVHSDELVNSEGFFHRLFHDKPDAEEKVGGNQNEKDRFFWKLFHEKTEEEEKGSVSCECDDGPEFSLFRKFFQKVHPEEDKVEGALGEQDHPVIPEPNAGHDNFLKRVFQNRSVEYGGKFFGVHREGDPVVPSTPGFFRRLFKDRGYEEGVSLADDLGPLSLSHDSTNGSNSGTFFQDSLQGMNISRAKVQASGVEGLEEDANIIRTMELMAAEQGAAEGVDMTIKGLDEAEHNEVTNIPHWDAGKAVEKVLTDSGSQKLPLSDSSLFDIGRSFMKRPGSPKQRMEKTSKSSAKPPLPKYSLFHIRRGVFHATLDFVQSLCDTSTGLADIFPMEDRHQALQESLVELNHHLRAAENDGGVCFPMGRGLYRVVHIPEDDFVLLNSREKAPYLICLEVLKCDAKSSPNKDQKDSGTEIRLARRGIPLASGNAQVQCPPPWAYPLQPEVQQPNTQQLLQTASKAIDLAMAHLWETKLKVVDVSFSVNPRKQETLGLDKEKCEGELQTGNKFPLVSARRDSDAANTEGTGEGMGTVSGNNMHMHCRGPNIGWGVGACHNSTFCSVGDQIKIEHPSVEVRSRGSKEVDDIRTVQLNTCCPSMFGREAWENSTDGRSLQVQGNEKVDSEMWVSVMLSVVPGVNMEDVEEEQPGQQKEHRRVPSIIAMDEVKAAVAEGEAPPGLPINKSCTTPSIPQSEERVGTNVKATDALAGELWENKKERIRRVSKWSSNSDWDLHSMIVKSGDDCRQEHLAVQLIAHFYEIYQEAGLPLWLRPYEVLVTSSHTALIETIYDTASIHAIKSRYTNLASLRDFFCKKYEEGSPSFKLAQRNFVESMAGYSILCYFLQVKDRHNANLLLDEDGHIIHIDFGFMLSNSPGGVNFESAPFKLTRELLEVMDSDAEGTASEFFDYFKVLCIQGFLTCQKHAERIILLVEMMQDSGCPCFKGGPRTLQNLRKRFHLSLTEEQCVSLVLSLISSSLDAWRTRQYDYYQRVLNGIL